MPLPFSESFDTDCTPPALPSGWSTTDASIWETTTATNGVTPTSPPNMLMASMGSSGVSFVIYGTADTNGGNVTAQANITSVGGSGNPGVMGVTARVSGTGDTVTCYSAGINFNTGEVMISRWSSGTETVLVSLMPTAGVAGWMTTILTCNGTALSLAVQNFATGEWLSPGGLWQASEAICLTATDSTITGAGQSGMYFEIP